MQAQATQALLTSFNEVDLKAVNELRARYKDQFEKQHGVKLGFMSFFAKACVEALKKFPAVNASVDGNDIVYHDYFDIFAPCDLASIPHENLGKRGRFASASGAFRSAGVSKPTQSITLPNHDSS